MEKFKEMIAEARCKAQAQARQSGLGRDITIEHELAIFTPIAIDLFYDLINQGEEEEQSIKICVDLLDEELSSSGKPTLQDIEGRLRKIWGL